MKKFAIVVMLLLVVCSVSFGQVKDLYNSTSITQALVPDTSRVTQYSAWVDNRDALFGTLWLVSVGSSDDSLRAANTIRVVLQDSSTGVAAAAVTSANAVIGTMSTIATGTVRLIDAPGEDSVLVQVQYVGQKRYSRIAIIRAGTHIETATSAVAVRMRKSTGPRP